MRRILCAACILWLLLLGVSAEEGHDWSEWIVDQPPTCTASGHRYRVCQTDAGDPHRQEETMSPLGHDYAMTQTAPSCTREGLRTFACTRCEERYTESYGAKTAHTYEEALVQEATCLTEGEKTFTCTQCGDSYSEALPVLEHSYAAVQETPPACTQPGIRRFACESCGEEYEEIFGGLAAHAYEKHVEREPDCAQLGVNAFVCAVCGDSYTEEFGEKTPHTYTVTEERGEAAITQRHICTVCGDEFVEVTPLPQEENTLLAANAAVGALNVVTAGVFAASILRDVSVLRWYRKRRLRLKHM